MKYAVPHCSLFWLARQVHSQRNLKVFPKRALLSCYVLENSTLITFEKNRNIHTIEIHHLGRDNFIYVERWMAVSSEYEFFLSRTICMTSFSRACFNFFSLQFGFAACFFRLNFSSKNSVFRYCSAPSPPPLKKNKQNENLR